MPFIDLHNGPDPELREFVKEQSKNFAAMICAIHDVLISAGLTDADDLQHRKIKWLAEIDRVAEEQKGLEEDT